MPIARFLRVVTFRPAGHESPLDAALRDAVVPGLLEGRDVLDAWIGRQEAGADRTRVLATTWAVEPAADAADLGFLLDDRLREEPPVVDRIDTLPVAVHARFERSEPARILRVFRGTVHPGELDAYTAEARRGMAADAEVNDGLIAFVLGAGPPDGFVSVSAWTGWPAIEAATGGNTRRPFATRNSARLAGFRIAHYEVLPGMATSRPPASSPAASTATPTATPTADSTAD